MFSFRKVICLVSEKVSLFQKKLFNTMAEVRDKILYSKETYDGSSEDEMGQRFVTRNRDVMNTI